MFSNILVAASLIGAAVARVVPRSEGINATPHDAYSSSIGVLGCLVDTNRIAYWPFDPDCNNLCKKVTYGDRSLHVLHVDTSGGAYDMSFDAWNMLVHGVSATEKGYAGGGEAMTYQNVSMDEPECQALLKPEAKGKLPLSAANSMNYIASCIDLHADEWVASNIATYNIQDPVCKWGYMESCDLQYPKDNLMHCPEDTGRTPAVQNELDSKYHVIDVKYSDGHLEDAASQTVVTEDQTSGASSLNKPSGATFKEEDKKSDSTEDSSTSTTTGPTSSPTSSITPFQALVVLGATIKNIFHDS